MKSKHRILEPARAGRTLLPVTDLAVGRRLLPLARAFNPAGEIVLVGTVTVPEGSSLSEGAFDAQVRRQELTTLTDEHPEIRVRVKPRIRVSHRPWDTVRRLALEESFNFILAEWPGPGEPLFGEELPEVLRQAPCGIVLASGVTGRQEFKRILVPIRGGPYARAALTIARSIARGCGGAITAMHSQPRSGRTAENEPWVTDILPRLRTIPEVTRNVIITEEVVPSILQEAEGHDLIVMGMSGSEDLAVGPVASTVVAAGPAPVLLVRTPEKILLPGVPEAAVNVPLSVRVDRWFAENTFHSSEFADLKWMADTKRSLGVTVSLGLPALNEEETVGKVITTVRSALMDEYPILDEIVLIDSGSTDDTVDIAEGLGVPVHEHPQILPAHGSFAGKGEALWKSLHVLKGDIIAWIDTDIRNIHPRFVYGLLGPLLRWNRVEYVKGFYRRPLRVGDKLQAGGGGRVTELVARPLLNLFFPELSGLVQPLSGEYAGRRKALERIPFFSGYGVETGMLIDLLDLYGLSSIAQVDLEERVHHNQPLVNLSRMSFAIIQVVVERLEARQKVNLLEDINRSMKLIQQEGERFYLNLEAIADVERPPMLTIPEYRAARGLE